MALAGPRAERVASFLVMIAWSAGAYFATNRYNANRTRYFDVALSFESQIPFVPEAVLAYLLVFVVIVMAYLSIRDEDLAFFRRAVWLLIVNVGICSLLFVLFPVKAWHRPAVETGEGFVRDIAAFYFWLDAPYNLFPSLHVNLSVLSALLCRRHGPVLGAIGMAMAVAVAVAVLLVRQHFAADVIAGAVLAHASYSWAYGMGPWAVTRGLVTAGQVRPPVV